MSSGGFDGVICNFRTVRAGCILVRVRPSGIWTFKPNHGFTCAIAIEYSSQSSALVSNLACMAGVRGSTVVYGEMGERECERRERRTRERGGLEGGVGSTKGEKEEEEVEEEREEKEVEGIAEEFNRADEKEEATEDGEEGEVEEEVEESSGATEGQ